MKEIAGGKLLKIGTPNLTITLERVKMQEKDKCVSCGIETEFDRDEHIDFRTHYVEGAGQLCKECFDEIWDKR
jgi:hypothetical protein